MAIDLSPKDFSNLIQPMLDRLLENVKTSTGITSLHIGYPRLDDMQSLYDLADEANDGQPQA